MLGCMQTSHALNMYLQIGSPNNSRSLKKIILASEYNTWRKLSWHFISTVYQQHYGPNCQQPDLSSNDLEILCQEYYALRTKPKR